MAHSDNMQPGPVSFPVKVAMMEELLQPEAVRVVQRGPSAQGPVEEV